MRWDNLLLDEVPSATVPLLERRAVVRTFDTPGFSGMTFYEVQARSIVNRVPEASRVPFRWTINPYRGCQHSCSYCSSGETPILMADGTARRIADVRVGDAIYGTVREGFYRRYAVTTVLAHWSTVKPAYRVTLEDGTRLIASGDHRFLTERGWKHVTGAEQGRQRRPFLTVNNSLMGFGHIAEGPKDCVPYRRGYLCGMHSTSNVRRKCHHDDSSYGRSEQVAAHLADPYRFRLAPADEEALIRTRAYIGTFGVRSIERQIAWPEHPCQEWFKGFLAGIFDAEGSYSRGIWRVGNTDPEIIGWTTRALMELGFTYAVETRQQPNGLTSIRLLGGLKDAMRFFHTTDPAITRKRSIEGMAIKSDANLQVAAVEPLGLEIPMYDITTGTGDFIANGVVSHNCFARNTHTYLDLDSGEDFNSKVIVKVNAPELLRKKLASPGWHGEHIAMGTNVDCYQRAEGRYQLMRGIIGALRDAANPFSILTKGTLILRDTDLLLEASEVTDVGLNVSAGFVDKSLWRAIEGGTPAPERRLEVCATFNDSGLGCGVLMGPIIPYLSDSLAQLDVTVRRIAEAGATHVSPIVLHLRKGAREWFMRWLSQAHPELVPRYAEFYGRGAYAPKKYQERIAGQVRELAERYGIGRGAAGRGSAGRAGPRGRGAPALPGPELASEPAPLPAPRRERPPRQATLF